MPLGLMIRAIQRTALDCTNLGGSGTVTFYVAPRIDVSRFSNVIMQVCFMGATDVSADTSIEWQALNDASTDYQLNIDVGNPLATCTLDNSTTNSVLVAQLDPERLGGMVCIAVKATQASQSATLMVEFTVDLICRER